ncbi:MAG: hypothetical protein Q8942_05770 [Bacillota bacterium]|nr:hypothetical protein [Bacillota bacterium]
MKKILLLIVAVLLIGGLLPSIGFAQDETPNFVGIAYGNGSYISIDDKGGIELSSDCVQWTNTYTEPNGRFLKVIWGNNQYMVLTTTKVLISPDGYQWTSFDFGNSEDTIGICDIIWDGKKYIGVGYSSIITSTDGLHWDYQDSKGATYLNSIIYTGTEYIAAGGYMGSGRVMKSTDGYNWSEWYGLMEEYGDDSFEKLCSNGKSYLFQTSFGNLFVSDNLAGGSSSYATSKSLAFYIHDIVSFNNQFVAIASNGTIHYSSDGKNWSAQQLDSTYYFNKIISSNGKLYILGKFGSKKSIFTSTDGKVWARIDYSVKNLLYRKISGYIAPDFIQNQSSVNSNDLLDFNIEIVGTNFHSKTDINGYFEILVPYNQIDAVYSIKISKQNYLQRVFNNMTIKSDVNLAQADKPLTMLIGDIDNNGVINIADIIQITKSFNSIVSDSRYNYTYDLNSDNAINIADIIMIAKNFNRTSTDYLN